MRIIGLDIGDKTIGVAVSDPLGLTAQGITTIHRKGKEKDALELQKIINEYSAELILSGLPKNMNGTIGEQGEKVIRFCNFLEKRLNVKVEYWDERLTTVAAHRAMIEADLSREKRKKIVDKLAAVYILQGYLDKNNFNKRRE
ncbi:putative holliday junction resolvase [Clostridium amylolyticum]|uniref:Putative pre-16S rRNA nuclease n=1 Tax=Clostridium amylolyticum TaxID=1121298 RepID=A0A1M6D0D2_9CLOT|nr:Holliday junction resolvase RuvX [Clostridium amylolyticum]SHI66670.1 putative holliday junction resolvase [Clostridium amylolyticum]